MPHLQFLIICLLFGSNFYLMKIASSAFGPVTIGAGRVLGGAMVLAVLWRLTARNESFPRRLLPAGVLIGIVSSGYPYALQPWMLTQGVEHSYLAMMVAFTPISIMLLSIPVLGVWPTLRQVAGIAAGLGFLGLLLLDGQDRGHSLGILLLMITVPLSYGVANAFLKRDLSGVAALPVTTVMLASAGASLAPLAFLGPSVGVPGPTQPDHWVSASLALLVLGCLGTGMTMWLWVRLVSSQGPLFAGMVTYVVPVVALLWGVFDGNQITSKQLAAIAGVLSMVALVQYGATANPPAAEAVEPDSPAEPKKLACASQSH